MDFEIETPSLTQQPGNPDDKLFVVFENKPVKNEAKSLAEGRPIYDSLEWITIRIPGQKLSEVQRKITQEDRERFASRYQTWKLKAVNKIEGTPLDQYTKLSITQIAELKELNIYTVEQLANVPDASIHRIGIGGRDLVNGAKAFLESSKNVGAYESLSKKHSELEDVNQNLQKQLKDQQEQINELLAASSRKKTNKAVENLAV